MPSSLAAGGAVLWVVDAVRLGQGGVRSGELPGVDVVEIQHDAANHRSAAVPRRLGFTEVGRVTSTEPHTPARPGISVVWQLHRPARPRHRR